MESESLAFAGWACGGKVNSLSVTPEHQSSVPDCEGSKVSACLCISRGNVAIDTSGGIIHDFSAMFSSSECWKHFFIIRNPGDGTDEESGCGSIRLTALGDCRIKGNPGKLPPALITSPRQAKTRIQITLFPFMLSPSCKNKQSSFLFQKFLLDFEQGKEAVVVKDEHFFDIIVHGCFTEVFPEHGRQSVQEEDIHSPQEEL